MLCVIDPDYLARLHAANEPFDNSNTLAITPPRPWMNDKVTLFMTKLKAQTAPPVEKRNG